MNKRQHRLISTAILMFILVMITALLPVSTQEVQAAKKAKTYKITYKLNGGKNNAKNVKKLKKGKSLTLKNPTRTGYTFKGWYTSKSLKKGKVSKIKKIKRNVTVYAKWSKQPATKKSSGSVNKPTTPQNPSGGSSGNSGGTTTKPTNPNTGSSDKPVTPPETPNKGTNHAADCPEGCTVDHAAECANGIHVYKTSALGSQLVRHYYTGCGVDITDLYNQTQANHDSSYLLWCKRLACPVCGKLCGNIANKDIMEGTEFVSKCKHCGKIYQSSVTQE